MKRYVDELMKRIDELIKSYELFLWQSEDRTSIITIDNEEDYVITFYLFSEEELVDAMALHFLKEEKDLYDAVCLKLFVLLFGNVKVYKMDNEFNHIYYNGIHKPYSLVVTDEEITKLFDEVIVNQDEETIKNHPLISDASKKVKKYLPNVPVLKELDERIADTKVRIRSIK